MKQKHTEQWVWLPEDRYPDSQTTIYSALIEKARGNYVVAEFSREYVFTRKVVSARIRFSAYSEDGIPEGLEIPGHPFALGVQWHPECMQEYDDHMKLFRAFVEACRK